MLPDLGIGVVYVPGLEPLLEPGSTCVDLIEIEPQTLWHFKSSASQPYSLPAATLQHLRRFPQPKIIHSVGSALGGTQRATPDFANALADMVRCLDAPWASEHLSITQVRSNQRSFHTGFMLPPLHTVRGAQIAAQTIRDLSDRLPVPLAVETGVNYLKARNGELTDGEFVAIAVEEADCGILLDIHNIWTNEQNGRQPTREFLSTIPLDRVWEIHLAGGFEFDGYWLDAHSGSVPPQVLELTAELIPTLPNLKAVTYEIFPSFVPLFGLDAIQGELEKIRELCLSARKSRETVAHKSVIPDSAGILKGMDTKQIEPEHWESTLGELVIHGRAEGSLARELAADDGIDLIRKLIWKFRAGSIVKSSNMLTQLIRLHGGEELLEALLTEFFRASDPQPFASEEVKGFIRFLQDRKPDVPYLDDIIAYEECVSRALLDEENQYAHFDYDPRSLLQALSEGVIPDHLVPGSYELEITP